VPNAATAEALVNPSVGRAGSGELTTTASFSLALTASFGLLELVNVLHHAMWRDEIQVWSLAQRCQSLWQFLTLKKYEDLGHPDAWHLLVYPLSRFTANPMAMQILHMFIAMATVYVIARYSPFPRYQKILIVFGYFFFYEYATISRGYAIGVLCLLCFCAAYTAGPKKNYLLLGALLALAAQANAHALMLATALALAIPFEALWSSRPRKFFWDEWPRALGAGVIFAGGVLFSAFRMSPPADSAFYPSSHLSLDPTSVGRTLAMMWKAFVPIPQIKPDFWNSNIVTNLPLVAVLSILVLAVSLLFFLRKPVVLFAYLAGLGALLLFRHVKYAGYLRHDGHAFILFIACAWLAYSYADTTVPLRLWDRLGVWFAPFRRNTLVAILCVQVIAAMVASFIALNHPFSQAKATADFIRNNRLEDAYIVGDYDAAVATVAGYLHHDVYYPRSGRTGTYIIWDTKRTGTLKESMLEVGKQKSLELHKDVLVVLNHPSPTNDAVAPEIASFPGSIVGSEDFYVYQIRYDNDRASR
jgi:hypothetical protein